PVRTRPGPALQQARRMRKAGSESWIQLPLDLLQRLVVRIELAHLAEHFARAVVPSKLPEHFAQVHADVRILLLAPGALQVGLGLAEIAEAILQPAPGILDLGRAGLGRERLAQQLRRFLKVA